MKCECNKERTQIEPGITSSPFTHVQSNFFRCADTARILPPRHGGGVNSTLRRGFLLFPVKSQLYCFLGVLEAGHVF